MEASDDDGVSESTVIFNIIDWCKAIGLNLTTEGKLGKEALSKPEALILFKWKDMVELFLPTGRWILLTATVEKEQKSAVFANTNGTATDAIDGNWGVP